MKNKLIYYFLIFLLGAIVGYIYEVIFYYFTLGFINNWGVLYGPYLPIYGVGAICLTMLKPLKKKPILLFILSILITGLVEYIIGYIALTLLNYRLWDYRGLLLNINGLVCLRSVLTFSIGSIILIYLIEPIIKKLYKNKIITNISYVILIIFILDIIISILFRTPYQFKNNTNYNQLVLHLLQFS